MVAGTKNKKMHTGARVAAAAAIGLSATFGVFALAPVVGGADIAFAQGSGEAVTAVQPAAATSRIQGFTWNDVNKNTVNDETNNALAAVIVRVMDASGNIVVATASDGAGNFTLDLETGVEAKLRYVAPSGWTPVFAQTGVTPEGSAYYDTAITPADAIVAVQMPFFNPNVTSTGAGGSTGGNSNSVTGNTNVIQAKPFPATSVTIPVTVTTVLDTLPPISTIAPSTTSTTSTTLAAAATTVGGPAATFKVCGVMYADKNGNGVQDGGEAPLAGAVLHITGPNGYAKDATADATGSFCLEGLLPGEYTNEIAANVPDEFKGTKRSFIVNADGSVREGSVASAPADATAPSTLANTGARRTSKQLAGGLSVFFAGLALVAGSASRKARKH